MNTIDWNAPKIESIRNNSTWRGMELPIIAKKESIGQPALFSGREQEMKDLLEWVDLIPKEQAKSRALMATKKMGKTAVIDRLYNVVFQQALDKKPGEPVVVPFFFEIREKKLSEKSFGKLFYRSFITQYLAVKCKQPKWANESFSFPRLVEIAEEFEFHEILANLKEFEWAVKEDDGSLIWEHASAAPHTIASRTGDFILQIIDEFQYLNKFIYTDGLSKQIDLAGTYHQWSESRIAPLLITGSWYGWLRDILLYQLNPRFSQMGLFPYPDQEALKAVYNYAELFNVDLSEESALALKALSRNHPWYISTLIRSLCPNKDLSTTEGVEAVFHHELTNKRGEIYQHWREYLNYAFHKTNGKHAQAIILYLSAERHEEKTLEQIQNYLKSKDLFLEDIVLEDKLKLLAGSDIIEEGSTASHYKGIPDDIFNQVVQKLYAFEIEKIDLKKIQEKTLAENRAALNSVDAKVFERNKGAFLESMMTKYIKYQPKKKSSPPLRTLLQNAPENAEFFPYQTVSECHFNLPEGGYHMQFDILAKTTEQENPSLLIECKYHKALIGPTDVNDFAKKVNDLKQKIPNLIPILYSVSGFTGSAIDRMAELQLAWSTPEFWDVLTPQKKK